MCQCVKNIYKVEEEEENIKKNQIVKYFVYIDDIPIYILFTFFSFVNDHEIVFYLIYEECVNDR